MSSKGWCNIGICIFIIDWAIIIVIMSGVIVSDLLLLLIFSASRLLYIIISSFHHNAIFFSSSLYNHIFWTLVSCTLYYLQLRQTHQQLVHGAIIVAPIIVLGVGWVCWSWILNNRVGKVVSPSTLCWNVESGCTSSGVNTSAFLTGAYSSLFGLYELTLDLALLIIVIRRSHKIFMLSRCRVVIRSRARNASNSYIRSNYLRRLLRQGFVQKGTKSGRDCSGGGRWGLSYLGLHSQNLWLLMKPSIICSNFTFISLFGFLILLNVREVPSKGSLVVSWRGFVYKWVRFIQPSIVIHTVLVGCIYSIF